MQAQLKIQEISEMMNLSGSGVEKKDLLVLPDALSEGIDEIISRIVL